MNAPNGFQERFFHWLSALAAHIDERLRFGDFRSNRTAGGLLDRTCGVCRHSYQYLLLPSLAAAIIVLGIPEFGVRLLWAVATFVVSLLLLMWLAQFSIRRAWTLRADMLLQVGLVLAVAGIVWLIGGDKPYHKGIGIYRNVFVLSAFIVSAALVIAGFVSGWVWKGFPSPTNYGEALSRTELFVSREPRIPLRWCNFVRAFFTVIPGAPLQLLLLPAVFILLSPPDLLIYFSIAGLAASYIVLLLGGFDVRLNQIWSLLQGVFFRGGALLVSLIIIALAVARLFDVSYVTTIFDTAEGTVIILLLFSAYVLFWWYDYWINRLLAQELLKLLNAQAVCDVQIPYRIDPNRVKTSVPAEGRSLQIHGSSRFLVVDSSSDYPHFQAHPFAELFETLAISGWPGGKAEPSPAQIEERILDFKYTAGTVLIILCAAAAWFIYLGVQRPELEVETKIQPTVQLAQLLEDHARNRGQNPALIIAASGGGTRAALYTAAVLEGLAGQGKAQDVIMGSGVSGGGAALAYFAGKRQVLGEANDQAWDEYFRVMSKPFIQDVINGAPQWRIVSDTRLGVLLSDSFKERWSLDPDRNELGEVKDFGLILNTAIAGRFVCDKDSKDSAKCLGLPLLDAEKRFRKQMTHTDLAGGRLIITNLLLKEGFARSIEETVRPKELPVIVADPATRLETAAALNANFPPVFSNAAIDVNDDKTRYWVTDGGAIDNRGMEMPLYALRAALAAWQKQSRLPAIMVVVVDASAYSSNYAQDRGVGTMMGAGTQYASLLVEEQLQSIQALYKQKGQPDDDFRFIYLPMPLRLRESGSFGTHWMLQRNIEIDLETKSRTIKGREMVDLLRAMHSPGQGKKLKPAAQAVLDYAARDEGWRKGALKLGFISK